MHHVSYPIIHQISFHFIYMSFHVVFIIYQVISYWPAVLPRSPERQKPWDFRFGSAWTKPWQSQKCLLMEYLLTSVYHGSSLPEKSNISIYLYKWRNVYIYIFISDNCWHLKIPFCWYKHFLLMGSSCCFFLGGVCLSFIPRDAFGCSFGVNHPAIFQRAKQLGMMYFSSKWESAKEPRNLWDSKNHR